MRIRRSARVMFTILLVLLVFSSLIIWHDKPQALSAEQTVAINALVDSHSQLALFLDQIGNSSKSFFSVGLKTIPAWPQKVTRACYPDQLAARGQFSAIQAVYSKPIEVIRYRSKADFCLLLLIHEREEPGYVSALNFKAHTPIIDSPGAISLKLILAFLVGVPGILIIRAVKKIRL